MNIAVKAGGTAVTATCLLFTLSPPVTAGLDDTRFQVVTRPISEHFEDVGREGPSIGDTFTAAEKLFRGGERVGSDAVSCQVIQAKRRAFALHCMATLTLRSRGDITVAGVTRYRSGQPVRNVLAITGGTGQYVGASGTVTVLEPAGAPDRIRVRLTG